MINALIAKQFVVEQLPLLQYYAPHLNLLIDCGAFGEHKAGRAAITAADYMKWIDDTMGELSDLGHLEGYFALDVIGDGDATAKNYEELLDKGYKPIPIFTRGSTEEQVRRFCETSDYIGVGGVAAGDGSATRALRYMSETIPEGIRQHWLGFTKTNYMRAARVKPWSVDSTSWQRFTLFGDLKLYRSGGYWENALMWDKEKRKPYGSTPDIHRTMKALRSVGLDASLVSDSKAWRQTHGETSLIQCLQVEQYINFATDVEAGIGTKYFFALGPNSGLNAGFLQHALEAEQCLCSCTSPHHLCAMFEKALERDSSETRGPVTPDIIKELCHDVEGAEVLF